jgi:phosphate/sulfate permease
MFVLIWIVLSLVVALVAESRGRTGFGFLVLSLLLSPLVGFLVVISVRNLAAEKRAKAAEEAREAAASKARQEEMQRQAVLIAEASKVGATSAADELEKLAALRDRGVITSAEFDERKARILSK